jgi:hypothetical protein
MPTLADFSPHFAQRIGDGGIHADAIARLALA